MTPVPGGRANTMLARSPSEPIASNNLSDMNCRPRGAVVRPPCS